MSEKTVQSASRRSFLAATPVAAATLALADAALFSAPAAAQSPAPAPKAYAIFHAQAIQDDIKALQGKPGDANLFGTGNFSVVLTTEAAKSAQEFEWHEIRDHIVQILEGTTIYELGGRPKDGRSIRPGEWLAPSAEGATALTLEKGDMLIIPRGTPHKRSTAVNVTFLLISPKGSGKN
jgi:quercetin dioxygenase-like cupin family protein